MWSIAPSFPAGSVGVGLLLLRCSVAAALLASICSPGLSDPLRALLAFISLAVLSGFKTRLFAFVSVMIAIFVSTKTGSMEFATVTTIDALALALIGPGAFSVDARLRGRRTVVLPETEPQ